MIIDKQLLVSDAQLITNTAVSTNSIDTALTSPIRNVGWGEDMRMLVTVGASLVGATSIQPEIISADDAALTVNVTSEALGRVTVAASAVAGGPPLMDLVLPGNQRRFVGTRYNVVGGPFTAGAVTAGLVHDSDRQRFYPSGYPDLY